MAGYRKKIAYLDYLENGMKMKNAGFVRLEENAGQMRLEMRVKNIPEIFEGQYELKADSGGTLGRVSLIRGSGSCCIVWKTGSKAEGKKRFIQANGVYVRLPGRHLLQAVWEEPLELCVEPEEYKVTEKEPAVMTKAVETCRKENAGAEVKLKAHAVEAAEQNVEQTGQQPPEAGPEETVRETAKAVDAGREAAEFMVEGGEAEAVQSVKGTDREERREEPVCYGDKWEQLTHMYAVIHPFGDGREYLSIAPKDFVVLRQEYQKMVHNSFLLHGYYNYKHLILGKLREKEGWCYYLGVPGNFYGREKMVAEMFGFEAFEGEKEPAKAGDFGYFMKRVEI